MDRDLAVGVRHGAYCLSCCWALMMILIAVGVMNVAAMVGLAIVVLIEKTWRWGLVDGRAADVAALALAVASSGCLAGPRPARCAPDDELSLVMLPPAVSGRLYTGSPQA